MREKEEKKGDGRREETENSEGKRKEERREKESGVSGGGRLHSRFGLFGFR